jgi:hypothetical protein
MPYFKGSLTEYNGEREYSESYLIEARDKFEAMDKLRHVAANYLDDDSEETEPGTFEFWGGEYLVKINGVYPTTKAEYIEEVLQRELIQ